MRRELEALREEVASLRALPAPPAAPDPQEAAPPARDPANPDPHGLRALVASLRTDDA